MQTRPMILARRPLVLPAASPLPAATFTRRVALLEEVSHFFADAPAPGFADVPLAKDSGFPIILNQFRSIVVRAGTDPKHVNTLAAALEKAARSPDFVKYLEDELAYSGSFIPAKDAAAFIEKELKLIESNAQKK